jgi:hypothetical protein
MQVRLHMTITIRLLVNIYFIECMDIYTRLKTTFPSLYRSQFFKNHFQNLYFNRGHRSLLQIHVYDMADDLCA